jgi:NAD(P)-dependent dehydrogenase (short-subunit alcohol dehydrogenase family)
MPAKLPEEHAALLAEKVALVTGASRGVGRAIASRLGRMGASVAICARSRDEIERTAGALRTDGIKTLSIVADVTRAEDVQKMIEQTCSQLGEIELLVNNAGIGVFGPFYQR